MISKEQLGPAVSSPQVGAGLECQHPWGAEGETASLFFKVTAGWSRDIKGKQEISIDILFTLFYAILCYFMLFYAILLYFIIYIYRYFKYFTENKWMGIYTYDIYVSKQQLIVVTGRNQTLYITEISEAFWDNLIRHTATLGMAWLLLPLFSDGHERPSKF